MSVLAAAAVCLSVLSAAVGCRKIEPETNMVLPVPEGLVLSLYDGTSLLLTWEPVEGADHYTVILADASTGNTVTSIDSVTETLAQFEYLSAGSYFCRVRAVNGYDYSDFAVSETVDVPDATEPQPAAGTDVGTAAGSFAD